MTFSINLLKNKLNYELILNYLIIAYAFCLPISKAGISLFGVLLILFWLIEGKFKEKITFIKEEKIFLTIAAFSILSILSVLWSNDKLFALSYLKKYWHFLVLPVIFTSLKKEYVKYVFNAFLLSIFISEIVSYGIFFEIWTKEGVSPHDPSPFIDHTSYSCFLAFTSFILIYKIFTLENIPLKLFFILYFLTAVTNMFINGGRTGQVIFLIGLLFILFKYFRKSVKKIILLISFFTILFFSFYQFSSVFNKRFNQTTTDINLMLTNNNYTGAFSSRVAMWMLGLKSFSYEPILGNGIGDEAKNIIKEIEEKKLGYFISSNEVHYYVDFHNMFIQYLSQLGILGFTLIILIFYLILKLKIDNSIYYDLKNLFVVIFILWSAVALTLHINTSLVFFVLFTGVFISLSKNRKEPDAL